MNYSRFFDILLRNHGREKFNHLPLAARKTFKVFIDDREKQEKSKERYPDGTLQPVYLGSLSSIRPKGRTATNFYTLPATQVITESKHIQIDTSSSTEYISVPLQNIITNTSTTDDDTQDPQWVW